MTLTGFVFLSEAVLSGLDSSVAYTLSQWSGNWWTFVFAALVLSFPSGRISSRIDWAVIGAFVFGTVVLQFVWLLFLPFPPGKENVFLIRPDADLANVIDRFESAFNATVGLALAVLAISRWLRAAPPLRRLLLPTLAGGVTALILVIQIYYDLLTGEFIRSSQQITAVLLVSVPLAFLFGILHQQLARAGMADLVVALQRAPGSRRLGEALAKALGDPSLVLAYWLPRFDSYVDAEGAPVALPQEGSGRATTFVDNDGHHIAALVHDSALAHQPELLEVVCAAANVALERERLQAELEARVVELQASRERIVTAGDAERRRLERNLHDGAQQRLVAIVLQLSLLKGRIQSDSATPTARQDGGRRARASLPSCASSRAASIPPCSSTGSPPPGLPGGARDGPDQGHVRDVRAPPRAVELAAYFVASEALANVAKYAHATPVSMRVWRSGHIASIEVADDGIGGATTPGGSGLRGLADRVEALGAGARLQPRGRGHGGRAELPCGA